MTLQQEKALATAQAVSRFIDDARRSLDWVTLAALPDGAEQLQQRRRRSAEAAAPATGDDDGRAARCRRQRTAARLAHRARPAGQRHRPLGRAGLCRGARRPALISGDVTFAQQTEPYATIAAPSAARDGSVVLADVNLKFVCDVVSQIKVGATGYAYVVDATRAAGVASRFEPRAADERAVGAAAGARGRSSARRAGRASTPTGATRTAGGARRARRDTGARLDRVRRAAARRGVGAAGRLDRAHRGDRRGGLAARRRCRRAGGAAHGGAGRRIAPRRRSASAPATSRTASRSTAATSCRSWPHSSMRWPRS